LAEWFENDEFWVTFESFLFPSGRMAYAKDEVEDVLALVRGEPKSVLDLCCGPGRHVVSFAKRGLAVTGVDRSPFLLGRAKVALDKAGLQAELVEEDMRRFRRPEAFDLAINLFTSFGFTEHPEDDLAVLRNLYESLKPGGACVLEMVGKEFLARVFLSTISRTTEDGALIVQRPEVIDDWTATRNEWIHIRDGKARSFWFTQRVYSGKELKELILKAGFNEVSLYGDLQGEPYGLYASRLVAVGMKL
jgi:SAM-dependent methyltransferase